MMEKENEMGPSINEETVDNYETEYIRVKGSCSTVGELIYQFKKIPQNYLVNATGLYDYGLVVDETNKTVLIDTTDFIDMLLAEQEERTGRAAAEM